MFKPGQLAPPSQPHLSKNSPPTFFFCNRRAKLDHTSRTDSPADHFRLYAPASPVFHDLSNSAYFLRVSKPAAKRCSVSSS